MDPHALDIAKSLDSALQLAFQRSLIIDLFIEFRLAPIQLVEQFKAEATAVRHAFAGNFQSAGIQLVSRDADCLSIGADFVRDALGRQPACQRLRIGGLHPGHERLVIGSDDEMSEEKNHSHDNRGSTHQQDELLGVEGRDGVLSLVRDLAERCHGLWFGVLELHARDFLIRADNLVTDLQH